MARFSSEIQTCLERKRIDYLWRQGTRVTIGYSPSVSREMLVYENMPSESQQNLIQAVQESIPEIVALSPDFYIQPSSVFAYIAHKRMLTLWLGEDAEKVDLHLPLAQIEDNLPRLAETFTQTPECGIRKNCFMGLKTAQKTAEYATLFLSAYNHMVTVPLLEEDYDIFKSNSPPYIVLWNGIEISHSRILYYEGESEQWITHTDEWLYVGLKPAEEKRSPYVIGTGQNHPQRREVLARLKVAGIPRKFD